MAWAVLVVSGMLETVWALALDQSEGFTKLLPSIVFLGALALSMIGLAYAVKTLPIGVCYAVWVGIGASLTVIYGMITGSEPVSAAKIILIVILICCVIGLKVTDDASAPR
ncbi:multidrug efflux SMR transporter [Adlercreutzia sp. ZJ138]|uniref:DMT family transporter n=1 Tax=Adlercreutzia sp. ZJ138 TaxID=2709405 RepID=UPI0013EBC2D4|nr:multidrug efflux SMR transporter [Adlercreutzia sp. ZJ138]